MVTVFIGKIIAKHQWLTTMRFCGSIILWIAWTKTRGVIEPLLFGGYVAIKILLSIIVLTCFWDMAATFWARQNSSVRYLLAGVIILLFTSVYYEKILDINRGEGEHYPMLAEAFSHGQVSLLQRPSAELLALPDPYDPAMNAGLKIHDALLFKDRYYIYSGPVPAVLLMIVRGIFRVGDGNTFLMLCFLTLCAWMTFLIVHRIWRRLFPTASWLSALLCFVTVTWSLPVMWQAGRPGFYEASITGGQAFLLTGIYFLFLALDKSCGTKSTDQRTGGTVSGRKLEYYCRMFMERLREQNLLLGVAGCSFGLAVGTRWNLAIAVVLISGLPLLIFINHFIKYRSGLKPMLAFFAPLVLCAVMYGYYNFARFGSPLDFGLKYQLPAVKAPEIEPFLFQNLLNNLILYGVVPPADWSLEYPYISFVGWSRLNKQIFETYRIEPDRLIGYTFVESFTSVWWVAPLAVAALWTISGMVGKLLTFRALSAPIFLTRQKDQLYEVVLVLGLVGSLGPLLCFLGVTMRYHMDYFPVLGLLASVGVLKLHIKWSNSRLFLSLLYLLASYTVLLGGLASITGYYNKFASARPEVISVLNQVVNLAIRITAELTSGLTLFSGV